MPATIQIDQSRPSGPSVGTPGVARNDLWMSRTISLIAAASASYSWSLALPAGSAASLLNPTLQTSTFVPDVPGTYVVTLSVNGGGGANTQRLVARVRFDVNGVSVNFGIVLPGFQEGESGPGESNHGGNVRGWDQPFEDLYAQAQDRLATTKHFDTFAALRAGTATGEHATVYARGSGSAGDGGAGLFDKVVGAAPADDLGVNLRPTGITTFWYRRRVDSSDISVRWFGATGAGGNTDDRAACQAALNYAGNQVIFNTSGGLSYASGPTVIFPRGNYSLGAELAISPGVRVEGKPGAWLQPTTAAGNTINLVRMGPADTYISRLGFRGGFNAIAMMGVDYDPTAGIHRAGGLSECTFAGQIGHAVWHDMTPISRPQNVRSFQQKFVIERCKYIGPHFIWAVCDDMLIRDCILVYDASNRPTTTVQAGCSFAAATNVITKTAHGFTNGMKVTPGSDGGFAGSGLTSGVVYYVINATADTFKLSLTPGGTEVDILTDSSGHFDLIKFQIDSSGASLPFICSGATVTLNNVTVEYGGVGSGMPNSPADRALLGGGGNFRGECAIWSFDGGGTMIRLRGTGNTYQGIGEATQTLDCGTPFFGSTLTASTNRIGFTAHGLSNDEPVTPETTGSGLTAGAIYFVINKTANDYQVATTRGGSAVDITLDGTVTMRRSLAGPSAIDIRGGYMDSLGTNLIEVYYEMPNFVWLTDMLPLNSDGCLGCWVSSDTVNFALESDGDVTNHRTFFQKHRGDSAPGNGGQLYNFGEVKGFRRWRMSAEADKYKGVGSAGVTDITERLVTYKVRNDDLVEVSKHLRDNLWPWTETDLIGGGHVTLGGNDYTTSGTEVETGYTSVKGLTTGDNAAFSFETADFGAGTLAAGVYTFSLDWKCAESGIFIFGYSLNGRICNLKAVETESGVRKRISSELYIPATSGGDTVKLRGTYFSIHTGKAFSCELPMLNKGYGAAPYVRPGALSGMTRIPSITYGTGSPENVVPAPVGARYVRIDGGAATTLYVKETGTGNTGWAAK